MFRLLIEYGPLGTGSELKQVRCSAVWFFAASIYHLFPVFLLVTQNDCRPNINLNDAHTLINFPYNLMWQNFVRRF